VFDAVSEHRLIKGLRMKKLLALLLFAFMPATAAFAMDIAGVSVPDTAKLENQELRLNGVGIRTRLLFKVYVGALYLGQKAVSAKAVLSDTGAKRVALHLLRDLKADQVSGALNEGLLANNSAEELAKLDAKIKDFISIMNSIGAAKKGSTIMLDYLPQTGTRISVNGEAKGSVAGEDFNRALLKIWLGDKPVDESLKKGMLGG
jgi:Chalcone isomerase-like